MNRLATVLHDLRSPLARAKTLAKLLEEASPEEREQFVRMLLDALDDLDKRLSELSSSAVLE